MSSILSRLSKSLSSRQELNKHRSQSETVLLYGSHSPQISFHELQEVIEPPQRLSAMPTGAAMAQVRRIEQALLQVKRMDQHREDEDEENELLVWLM